MTRFIRDAEVLAQFGPADRKLSTAQTQAKPPAAPAETGTQPDAAEAPFDIDAAVPALRQLLTEVKAEEQQQATRREYQVARVAVATVIVFILVLTLGLAASGNAWGGLSSLL